MKDDTDRIYIDFEIFMRLRFHMDYLWKDHVN